VILISSLVLIGFLKCILILVGLYAIPGVVIFLVDLFIGELEYIFFDEVFQYFVHFFLEFILGGFVFDELFPDQDIILNLLYLRIQVNLSRSVYLVLHILYFLYTALIDIIFLHLLQRF
jgi:hypothetical protein